MVSIIKDFHFILNSYFKMYIRHGKYEIYIKDRKGCIGFPRQLQKEREELIELTKFGILGKSLQS